MPAPVPVPVPVGNTSAGTVHPSSNEALCYRCRFLPRDDDIVLCDSAMKPAEAESGARAIARRWVLITSSGSTRQRGLGRAFD